MYSTRPCDTSEWWWVACDSYGNLKSSNTRRKIRKGHERCIVRPLSTEWIAHNAYSCYRKASKRYKGLASPVDEDTFKKNILEEKDGPFEYWGVFVKNILAGYIKCTVEGKEVNTTVVKFDPDYFKSYTSYALIDTILDYYVTQKKMRVNDGMRTIFHQTSFQDFLMKFGFKKLYVDLKVHYRFPLNLLVSFLMPFRSIIEKFSERFIKLRPLSSLLLLEYIHRETSKKCK